MVSLNVRGMRVKKIKPKQVKAWLSSFPTPPQIILLQEHHLGKVEAQDPARGVEFWQGESYWNEGVLMGRSQKINVGTAIFVDKTISPLITDHGILVEGHAQFITLQPPGEGSLTIINIYASFHSTDRAQLWQKVSQTNFNADHVILEGDFNHQEVLECRGNAELRQMNRRESSSWHLMTFKYGLSDAWRLDNFRKLSKKEFTFNNGRPGASSAMSRIDKFLVSQSVEERGGRIETVASVRKLSNHSPLVILVWGKQQEALGNRTRLFDISFLSEESGRKELWEAWVGNHPPRPPTAPSQDFDWPAWLESAIGWVMSCNACLSKAKRRNQGACIRANTKKIQLAEVQLQRDPANVEVRGILSEA